jgi:hypothetical protein
MSHNTAKQQLWASAEDYPQTPNVIDYISL